MRVDIEVWSGSKRIGAGLAHYSPEGIAHCPKIHGLSEDAKAYILDIVWGDLLLTTKEEGQFTHEGFRIEYRLRAESGDFSFFLLLIAASVAIGLAWYFFG